MSAASITVIIVSRGLQTLLRQCLVNLQVALDHTGNSLDQKIVIVDNASKYPYRKDEFIEPGLDLIRLDKASSFSTANNLAATACPADYYLLLNNDVLLDPDAITSMLSVLRQHPQAGICGTRMLFPDGSIQHCGVVFGADSTGPYHCFRKRPGQFVNRILRQYQAVTGACLLVRNKVWVDLSGLDERYPFGLEDVDFCLRARLLGWHVFCSCETDSLHFESMTPGRVKLDVGSRRIFMNKWQGHYSIDG